MQLLFRVKMVQFSWTVFLLFLFFNFHDNSVEGLGGLTRAIGATTNNNFTQGVFRQFRDAKYNVLADQMKIKVYQGRTIKLASIANIPVTSPEAIYQQIDHTKPVVIYIHGYREHPSNESIRTVVGAYLERGTDNILLLDWSEIAFNNYLLLLGRVKQVAEILAHTFDGLVELGMDLEESHIIGHSMGAQIAGFFGRYSRYSIPRITGLDPAFPGFYFLGSEHVDADSARFVDIIHTDGGVYGALDDTGTVDFYPNGGTRPMPGCDFLRVPFTPSDLCNHWRSWRYYAETVVNNYAFPATQCDSLKMYKAGECDRNRKVFYGYNVPRDIRGRYYFLTNAKAPYGNEARYFSWNSLQTL